jgi:hypothetical protein
LISPGISVVYILRKQQMSAGGQRGIDISGINTLRIQYASDFVTSERLQLVYQTFASTTGANAYINETPNATGSYLDFLQGRKEVRACIDCSGLSFGGLSRSFRT